ncbi:hypothetical protein Ae201684_004468 [Aphanomyces euteiches]|uniref:Uncharacterized protein n=1 Tax=Aphanomyces euteiches TaxID=100861 RepID=A0A6G0XII3_9STRA|nr:hypothetical protein Ae201684_004468 [Aphanomyces euteiches]
MVSLRWVVAIAAIIAPSLQSSCSSIENDVDYDGPDLRSVVARLPMTVVLFVLKTTAAKPKGNPIFKSGVRSATLASPWSQCSAIENDIDYDGPDLTTPFCN